MSVNKSGKDIGGRNMEPADNIKNNEKEFSHSLLL
jgi:hypothetical protein